MSSFTTELKVSPQPDGKNWKVLEEFDYHVGSEDSNDVIHIPVDFLTDFASIPEPFRMILSILFGNWVKYNKAAPVHDFLCREHKRTNKEIDGIFYEAMLVDFRNHKYGKTVAKIEYYAVRYTAWLFR